jgi:hypothetical protein
MAKSGADNRTYKEGVKERVKKGDRHTFPLEEPLENKPSENKSRYKKQRVPPE